MNRNEQFDILHSYRWIKVPKFVDDESLTWEERFRRLESHHNEETVFLINKVREITRKFKK